jgi:hypothetical protein
MGNGTNLDLDHAVLDLDIGNVLLLGAVGIICAQLLHGLAAAGGGTSALVDLDDHAAALLALEHCQFCHIDLLFLRGGLPVIKCRPPLPFYPENNIYKKDYTPAERFFEPDFVQFCIPCPVLRSTVGRVPQALSRLPSSPGKKPPGTVLPV